jgi:hypothetical protein
VRSADFSSNTATSREYVLQPRWFFYLPLLSRNR